MTQKWPKLLTILHVAEAKKICLSFLHRVRYPELCATYYKTMGTKRFRRISAFITWPNFWSRCGSFQEINQKWPKMLLILHVEVKCNVFKDLPSPPKNYHGQEGPTELAYTSSLKDITAWNHKNTARFWAVNTFAHRECILGSSVTYLRIYPAR